MADPLTNFISLEPNNLLTDLSLTNKLKLILNPASGLFNGSILSPGVGNVLPFRGVLWDGTNGFGYFLDSLSGHYGGEIFLSPAP